MSFVYHRSKVRNSTTDRSSCQVISQSNHNHFNPEAIIVNSMTYSHLCITDVICKEPRPKKVFSCDCNSYFNTLYEILYEQFEGKKSKEILDPFIFICVSIQQQLKTTIFTLFLDLSFCCYTRTFEMCVHYQTLYKYSSLPDAQSHCWRHGLLC